MTADVQGVASPQVISCRTSAATCCFRSQQTSACCFAGATLHEGEAVVAWRPTPDGGVQVETRQGVYTAQRLVLTAGAWLPQLVPALQVSRIFRTAQHISPRSLLL